MWIACSSRIYQPRFEKQRRSKLVKESRLAHRAGCCLDSDVSCRKR